MACLFSVLTVSLRGQTLFILAKSISIFSFVAQPFGGVPKKPDPGWSIFSPVLSSNVLQFTLYLHVCDPLWVHSSEEYLASFLHLQVSSCSSIFCRKDLSLLLCSPSLLPFCASSQRAWFSHGAETSSTPAQCPVAWLDPDSVCIPDLVFTPCSTFCFRLFIYVSQEVLFEPFSYFSPRSGTYGTIVITAILTCYFTNSYHFCHFWICYHWWIFFSSSSYGSDFPVSLVPGNFLLGTKHWILPC